MTDPDRSLQPIVGSGDNRSSAGIHPRVVMERLGHSSIAMTLDLYSHSIPAMQADAADRIAALIEAAG